MNEDREGQSQWRADFTNVTLTPKTFAVDANVENLTILFTKHPEIEGRIFFDDFSYQIYKRGLLPWEDPETIKVSEDVLRPLDDFDYPGARVWAAQKLPTTENRYAYGFHIKYNYPGTDTIRDAFFNAASINRRDLLRERLQMLPNPEKDKALLDDWLYHCAPIDSDLPKEYVNVVARKFLISLIARGLCRPEGEPIKVDTMLVFEGNQGLGKSRFAAALCGNDRWFADRLGDLKDKDAIALLQGRWVIEIGELAATKRSSQEDLKAYLSAPSDTFRPHYGKSTITRNRRCVFIGTTNDAEYIKDPTGGRRFWPIKVVGDFNIDWLKENREQLLAEAKAAYEAGEKWWIDNDEPMAKIVKDIQSGKMIHDIERLSQIQEYLKRWRVSRQKNGQPCLKCKDLYIAMRSGDKPISVFEQQIYDTTMEQIGWVKRRVRLIDGSQCRVFVNVRKDIKEIEAEINERDNKVRAIR